MRALSGPNTNSARGVSSSAATRQFENINYRVFPGGLLRRWRQKAQRETETRKGRRERKRKMCSYDVVMMCCERSEASMPNEDGTRKEKSLSETAVMNGPPQVFTRVIIHRGLSLPSPHRHSKERGKLSSPRPFRDP